MSRARASPASEGEEETDGEAERGAEEALDEARECTLTVSESGEEPAAGMSVRPSG